MKNAIVLLIAMMLLVTPSLASEVTPDQNTLIVKGFYLKATCVEYQVFKVEEGFNTLVETDKSLKAYKLELNIGTSYMILFTKGTVTKTLYITPTEPGVFELDVCMSNDHCAKVSYDPKEHTYMVARIQPTDYVTKH